MKQLLVIPISLIIFISCNQSGGNNMASSADKADSSKAEKAETKEERNKKIVGDAMSALNAHDIDKLTGMMATDAVDYGDGSEKPLKSADSIKAHMKVFLTAFPDFKADNLKYYADGNDVVVIGEYTGTFKSDLGKMKSTGKSFKFKDADIFVLNDEGKITSHSYVQSDATMFSQINPKK